MSQTKDQIDSLPVSVASDKKYTLHLVSHIHWDREWYLPFQHMRMRFVDFMDYIVDVLENNSEYKYFTLDGQTALLEDYLLIRPEMEETLKRLVRDGRLLIGPWYVQPDEFAVSGESLIRNLEFGHKLAEKFGAVMKVGYLPDNCGHISQMPQLLQDFGIDSAVVMRGIEGDAKEHQTEYKWVAPDGSSVILSYMATGFNNGKWIGTGHREKALDALDTLESKLLRQTTTPNFLILFSNLFPFPNLPERVKHINDALLNRSRIVFSTLPKYIDAVKKSEPQLSEIKGELRGFGSYVLLPGITSARAYLKQRNSHIQSLLERWAEPFATFAWMLGNDYPRRYLELAWKELLLNQFQDSIGGCSVDTVHEEMLHRFSQSEQIAELVIKKGLGEISSRVDTSDFSNNESALILFNPLNWKRTDVVKASIAFPMSWRVKDFTLLDQLRNEVDFFVRKKSQEVKMRFKPLAKPYPRGMDNFEIVFLAQNVPAYGYTTYRVALGKRKKKGCARLIQNRNTMENEHLLVTINDDGTLKIIHKETGAVYERCNYFEDMGDAGDEYSYAYPEEDIRITTVGQKAKVSKVSCSSIHATYKVQLKMRLPTELTKNRRRRRKRYVCCPITSFITLSAGMKRVDISTEIDNRAKDHRLRVMFPTDISTDFSYADAPFDIVKRPVRLNPNNFEDAEEDSIATYPFQNFVAVSNSERGLAIFAKGTYEYQITDESEQAIALTLLRCVGFISYPVMTTRRRNIAPVLKTPGAQCIGKYQFEYSIYPFSGVVDMADVLREALQHNVPMREYQTWAHRGELPLEASFLEVNPDNVLVSAIKKSEEADSFVLRLWNPSEQNVESEVRLPNQTNELLDSMYAPNGLAIERTQFSLDVPAKGITTAEVSFKED